MEQEQIEARIRELDDLMARLERRMSHDALIKKFGMTASQIFILRYLDKCDWAKASDIAKVAGLSPGAVTQVCDEMERGGLIERARSTEDRRVVHVLITEMGRRRLADIRKHRSARMQQIFSEIGASDAGEFVRVLGRVIEVIERQPGGNQGV